MPIKPTEYHTIKWWRDNTLLAMELPDGFDDAPRDVQLALFESKQSVDLVEEIRAVIASNCQNQKTAQLQKHEKAELLLELRGEHRLADAEPAQQPTEDSDA